MNEELKTGKQYDYTESHKDIKKALNYEYNLYADETYDSCMWEIEKKYLLKEIGSIKKGKIKYLDFACGTGRVISFVEPLIAESTGVDVSNNMLDIAKNKTIKSRLINCDLTTKDVIKGEEYDLITVFRFFLNAQDELRRKVMPLLSEKLSNNGLLIFNIHGNTSSYHLLPVILWRLGIKKTELKHLSYFETLDIIRKSNLKLIKLYGVGFIPSSFYRWFKPLRKILLNLDNFFSRIFFLKYFSRYLIYVCTKNNVEEK
jgi:SAM-dependent methyltransferase